MSRMHHIVANIAIIAGITSAVGADVTASDYNNSTDYYVRRVGIPDFDQKRSGLPGNGSCHCVPTSSLDLLMYAANHGFNQIIPGPTNWNVPATYNDATTIIGLMGQIMNTGSGVDPEGCGTNLTNMQNGVESWLSDSGAANKLDVAVFAASGGWSPTDDFVAQLAAMPTHPLIAVCFGRYDQIGMLLGFPLLSRVNGHCVAYSAGFRSANDRWMDVRNPSNSSSILTQAPFTNSRWAPLTEAVAIQNSNGDIFFRTVTLLNWTPGDDQRRILDSAITITPRAGYSFTSTNVQQFGVNSFAGTPGNGSGLWEPSTGMPVLDIAVQQDNATIFSLNSATGSGSPRTLHRIDPASGVSTKIATIAGASRIATGRQRDLYVLGGTTPKLRRFNPDASPMTEWSVSLPVAYSAIAYDHDLDQVVLLNSSLPATILRIPRDIASRVEPWELLNVPTFVPLGANPRIAICPIEGYMWTVSGASNSIFGVYKNAAGAMAVEVFSHPSVVAPKCVEFSDNGFMHVVCNAGVLVFKRGGGTWSPTDSSAFVGQPVGSVLRLTRSLSNLVAGEHDQPEWLNVPSEQIPEFGIEMADCLGDLDGNGAVNGADLAIVLGQWGCVGAACTADLNSDSIVNGADLAIVLGAWGNCD